MSVTMLAFILDYFQEKLMTKCFKKIQKPLLWDHFEPFFPNLDKNELTLKKGLCQFLNIPTIYYQAKNQKKLMSHS